MKHNNAHNFALIGAGGYVAPRHMQAIKDVGGRLVAAVDKTDSVGVLDSFNKDCEFFTEFERFDRHCELLRRSGNPIEYVSVASPNYLHDAHCRFGMRIGADVICEKPLCTHTRNIDALVDMERETGRKVNVVLQLRYHPEVLAIKKDSGRHKVNINYVTPRGEWYFRSWKADIEKSGGLATNIGIHLFDLASWLFGPMKRSEVKYSFQNVVSGNLELERADVDWRLSVIKSETPQRIFEIDGETVDLSGGFQELHSTVYREILNGNGFGPSDVREGVRIAETIRNDSGLGNRAQLQAA